MVTVVTEEKARPRVATTISFDEIREPGAYISHNTGHLIRVPEEGLRKGNSPTINIESEDRTMLTKISDDPYCTLSRARRIAPDLDIEVHF